MRKIGKIAIVALAAASMMGLGVSAASADPGNGSATPFKASYTYGQGVLSTLPADLGTWDCSGARVVNKNVTKDSETCTVSGDHSGWPIGSFSSLATFAPFYFWQSDFSDGAIAIDASGSTVANLDGTLTFTIVAIYPNS